MRAARLEQSHAPALVRAQLPQRPAWLEALSADLCAEPVPSSGDRHSLEIAEAPGFAVLRAVVAAADLDDDALRIAVREAYTRIGRLLRERALSRFRELRRYVVRHCDVDAITRAFTGRFPGLERLEIAMADLCRDELLLEAEGVAALDAPALAP